MTDIQLLTAAIAIVFPLSMLLYSNSRITDVRDTMKISVTEAKETLRAEMKTMQAEILGKLALIDNKLDHLLEIVAKHEQKLGGGN